MSVAERRQDIIEYLCEVRFETRANLMFRYSVSKNTIDRDLEALSCKYPIVTKQGNGGGIHIMDGFQLGKKYLSKDQTELLKGLIKYVEGDRRERLVRLIEDFSLPKRG